MSAPTRKLLTGIMRLLPCSCRVSAPVFSFYYGDDMAAVPSPTVRRKRLGTELRRLREQAGLTCESVGQRLDCSGTRISRMETGRISVRPGDVRELLDVYGVTGDAAGVLVELAREARRKGWWHRFGPVMPSWLEPYLGLEAEAVRLRDFQSMVLPGLVQTEDYARAALLAAPGAAGADDIEQQLALRMTRQQVLDGTAPTELCLVLSEGVLQVPVGGPAVLRAQLRKLAEMASCGQVTLQVLPADAAAQVHPVSSFTLLDFADPADPPVVFTEHLTGGLLLDQPDQVRTYAMVFDQLRAAALGPGPSVDLIARLAAN
jgi:transcriptional regulator with XRE-family HTH domain